MPTTYQLPVPGPDPSKEYTVCIPPSVPDKLVSKPGDVVTVSVLYSHLTQSQTISFILSAKQALPWLDHVSTNIPISTTISLYHDHTEALSVTLKSLTRPAPAIPQSLLDQAEALRQEGNTIFKRSENNFRGYKSAILCYGKAADRCRLANRDPCFLAKIYSNISLASLRTCENAAALSHADVSHSLVDTDAKVLYRRALAYVEFDHPVRALGELNQAGLICPEDSLIKRERKRISAELVELLAKRRQLFAEVYNVMLRSPVFDQPCMEA